MYLVLYRYQYLIIGTVNNYFLLYRNMYSTQGFKDVHFVFHLPKKGAGADLKLELEPKPIFLGRLRLLFLASEKQNDLKMFIFHCILYIFLYNKYLPSTCWLYLQLSIRTR